MESETLLPSVYRMNNEFSIADCPGFSDSRGDNVEIINSVAIGKVLKTPDRCSLVVVMSYPSMMSTEQRGKGVKELIEALRTMSSNENKNAWIEIFRKVKFVVTQYNNFEDVTPVKSIKKAFKDFLKTVMHLNKEQAKSITQGVSIVDAADRYPNALTANQEIEPDNFT